MAENETNLKPDKGTKAEVKAEAKEGLTTPFADSVKKLADGVDAETRLFHGVDPESHERVTVTIEGLKAEFGDKAGEQKYVAIAGIAQGSIFFNPNLEATSYRPPLGIGGLSKKHAEEVAAILSAKE